MALGFFSWKKPAAGTPAPGSPAPGSSGAGTPGSPKTPGASGGDGRRDERKARKFFEHARTIADARNFDYAIDCYINGLKQEPDNMKAHEELLEVARRRKVAGGKPAGMGEKFKSGGKDPAARMLHAEKLWAMDPLNGDQMIKLMELAVEADKAEPKSNIGEVAYWVGTLIIEGSNTARKPDKAMYLRVCDLFEKLQRYDRAVEACRLAMQLDPEDSELVSQLKDLEAERTMQEGGYNIAKGELGSFQEKILNIEKQRELELETGVTKSDDAQDELIRRRRADLVENPEDADKMMKLVQALEKRETDPAAEEAIRLLENAHKKLSLYKYKLHAGNIRMKALNRQSRLLKAVVERDPHSAIARQHYQEALAKQLAFELEEYNERVQNYPTDMGLRFQLGVRLYKAKRYDEAIGFLQDAQADPKNRASALYHAGLCYEANSYHQEAVDTLKHAIEAHPLRDDPLALRMRYALLTALEQQAIKAQSLETAREAGDVASQVLQTDINYSDIRHRLDKIRKLIAELEKKQGG